MIQLNSNFNSRWNLFKSVNHLLYYTYMIYESQMCVSSFRLKFCRLKTHLMAICLFNFFLYKINPFLSFEQPVSVHVKLFCLILYSMSIRSWLMFKANFRLFPLSSHHVIQGRNNHSKSGREKENRREEMEILFFFYSHRKIEERILVCILMKIPFVMRKASRY